MTEPRHPAKFTDAILARSVAICGNFFDLNARVLDPFAGTGKGVNALRAVGYDAVGVELEPEWAAMSPHVLVGNALALPFADATFQAVMTSCTYGNRMADHHDAKDSSRRNTYRHAIGRPLHPENSGAMQWGDAYRDFHWTAWQEVWRVLQPEGFFLLNVKDHIRKRERQYVTEWHYMTCLSIGFAPVLVVPVQTSGNRYGENHAARVEGEHLILFKR